MRRDNVNDLTAFIAVAREQSFTKAAAQLGVSQSALSYTIRTLEARLGLRLLTRTTRSVSLTEAGERLLRSIGPHFDEIESEIAALSEMRDKPAGTIRITTVEHAAETILWPALAPLLAEFPDINVEIISDYGLKDIVADRYDAGVRLGEQVDKDMISLRISADVAMPSRNGSSWRESRLPGDAARAPVRPARAQLTAHHPARRLRAAGTRPAALHPHAAGSRPEERRSAARDGSRHPVATADGRASAAAGRRPWRAPAAT